MPTSDEQSSFRNNPTDPRDRSLSPIPEHTSAEPTCGYKFSFVPGFFIDYVGAAQRCPDTKVTTQAHLGIIERAYDGEDLQAAEGAPQWARFANHVERLNSQSADGVSYKLLFVIRHGRGVHNQVMDKVGPREWKDKWSRMDGDGGLVWADALLVDEGSVQAQELAQLWVDGVQHDGMPLPQGIYTSPLARCLETTKLVYTPVLKSYQRNLQPTVKELLRERLTDHTCDKRSPMSWIKEKYPDYKIEDGFIDEDLLWHADKTESPEEHVIRKQKLLADIFAHNNSAFISLTTHSYAISALLEVIGAPKFRVGEGVMIPLFVKAEKVPKSGDQA